MKPILVAIPVKPFGIAKQRLSSVIPTDVRPLLSQRLAEHTLNVVRATVARPVILSADVGVTEWARSTQTEVLLDPGSSLDQAARGAVDLAIESQSPWIILHADLPLIRPETLEECLDLLQNGRTVLAASSDGGTSLIGGIDPVQFRYGPGSFHRHLAMLSKNDPAVLSDVGLALDLDEPEDLVAAVAHPAGAWLEEAIAADTVP